MHEVPHEYCHLLLPKDMGILKESVVETKTETNDPISIFKASEYLF